MNIQNTLQTTFLKVFNSGQVIFWRLNPLPVATMWGFYEYYKNMVKF